MTRKQTFRTRPFRSISARLPLGLALALLVVLIALPLSAAYADTFVVTTTEDVVDADDCAELAPEDLPGPDGFVSLREAICAANNNPLPDTIDLGPHTYELSIEGQNENENATGDLDVLYEGDDLTIVGEGATSTTIDARQIDRVFDLEPAIAPSRTITISGVTVQGGRLDGQGGGGILNNAKLIISDSTIYSNTAGYGGGIYSGGRLTLTHCTIFSNTATDDGGGIANSARLGAPPPTGTAIIRDSIILHNRAANSAGGIVNVGTMIIINSTVYSNTAEASAGGGLLIHEDARATTITGSTISDNRAGSTGGGIRGNAPMTLTNSTLSSNRAYGHAGGIYIADAADVAFLTITENSTEDGNGGGIFRELSAGTVTLKNTIVAGNTDQGGEAHDCGGTGFTQESNLVGQDGNANGCPTPSGTSVVSGAIGEVLDPLGDNGGETETHALVLGSPAIDGATDCTDVATNPVTTDQRGVARPQGLYCDIGAYEAQPDLSIVKTVVPGTGVPYHGLVTYTIVLGNSGVVTATGVEMSDTLPAQVDFVEWVNQPADADVVNDVLDWQGPVPPDTDINFSFVATHTGEYGDVVTNRAAYQYSGGSGSDDATFRVQGLPPGEGFYVYLPVVLRNW